MPTGTRRKTGGVLKKKATADILRNVDDATLPPVAVSMVGGEDPFKEPMVGLRNGNNICYMNTVFQLLYSIPEFKDYIEKTDFDTITPAPAAPAAAVDPAAAAATPATPPDITKHKEILKVVKTIFNLITNATPATPPTEAPIVSYVDNPTNLTTLYTVGTPSFPPGSEQDVEEFLRGIFSILLEIQTDVMLNFRISTKETITCENTKEVDTPNLEYILHSNIATKDTITIQDYEKVLSELIPGKADINKYIEAFNTLKNRFECDITLKSCIEDFQKEENFTQKTDSCGEPAGASGAATQGPATKKKITIEPFPAEFTTLVIQLKRFGYGTKASKITRLIEPDQEITINGTDFYLDGLIYHTGTRPDSGHYIYVKYKDGLPYKSVSDTTLTTFETDDALYRIYKEIKENGYLFLYRKGKLTTRKPLPQPPITAPKLSGSSGSPLPPEETLDSIKNTAKERLQLIKETITALRARIDEIDKVIGVSAIDGTAFEKLTDDKKSDVMKQRGEIDTNTASLDKYDTDSKAHGDEAEKATTIDLAKAAVKILDDDLAGILEIETSISKLEPTLKKSPVIPASPDKLEIDRLLARAKTLEETITKKINTINALPNDIKEQVLDTIKTKGVIKDRGSVLDGIIKTLTEALTSGTLIKPLPEINKELDDIVKIQEDEFRHVDAIFSEKVLADMTRIIKRTSEIETTLASEKFKKLQTDRLVILIRNGIMALNSTNKAITGMLTPKKTGELLEQNKLDGASKKIIKARTELSKIEADLVSLQKKV